ncbi:MAG: TIGR03087 family PEP-CTERM/XrtA system glycosyltransferase [Pseudomonadota bacterium]
MMEEGERPSLLFLAHRIPFPPDKGDKIRSYHLLRFLSHHFEVYLGAFVDDPNDWAHEPTLKGLCAEVYLRGLEPTRKRILSLSGLLSGEALSLPYYRDARLQSWVRDIISTKPIVGAVTFSSTMAQYTLSSAVPTVADIVDLDSAKWSEYATRASGPMAWVYRREAAKLREVEEDIIRKASAAVLISDTEGKVLDPALRNRLTVIGNGVDTEYFRPGDFTNPFPDHQKPIVFTGVMDYFANEDAVGWFCREVLPAITNKVPSAAFYIVGSRPTERVRKLAHLPNVTVTGRVEDVRPYLQHAYAVVTPLQIARGVQNKVLEALAMARPLISTSAAMDGIASPGTDVVAIEDAATDFAAATIQLLDNWRQNPVGRQFVEERYGWDAHLSAYLVLFNRHFVMPSGSNDGQQSMQRAIV